MMSPDLSLRSATIRRGWLLAALALTISSGCYREPTRWDEVQQETRGKKAVDKAAIHGSAFNKFFPKSDDTYSIVFTQEKNGSSLADVNKGGETVATIAIADVIGREDSTSDPRDDFQGSGETVGGYPYAKKGGMGGAVLVANRVMVTVRSKDANIDEAQRKEWLQKVDLANLEQMVKTH